MHSSRSHMTNRKKGGLRRVTLNAVTLDQNKVHALFSLQLSFIASHAGNDSAEFSFTVLCKYACA
jgi:hypothetical protein